MSDGAASVASAGTCGTHATALPCEECRAEVKRMHAEWKASGVCAPPLCTLPSGHAGAHARASFIGDAS